jgi:hypothetical protein
VQTLSYTLQPEVYPKHKVYDFFTFPKTADLIKSHTVAQNDTRQRPSNTCLTYSLISSPSMSHGHSKKGKVILKYLINYI